MRKFITVCFLLILFVPTLTAQEPDLQSLCSRSGGFIDTESGECKVLGGIDIQATLPLQYADLPVVFNTVNPYITNRISQFKQAFANSGFDPFGAKWELLIDNAERRHSEIVLTVIVDEYAYIGGAHGSSTRTAFTFDLEANRQISINDVFTDPITALVTITPLARQQLAETLARPADDEWIVTGTDPLDPINYQTWALTETSIIFYFGEYQVAEYAAGPQQVEIPLSALTTVLTPEFAPES